jgi:hypothetical protein
MAKQDTAGADRAGLGCVNETVSDLEGEDKKIVWWSGPDVPVEAVFPLALIHPSAPVREMLTGLRVTFG